MHWSTPERDNPHSDKGSQYVSLAYTQRLNDAELLVSTGSTGDSYDNAMAENINGLYKAKVIHRQSWKTRQGILISGSGMRSVWLRHDLECVKKRLTALEIKMAQEGGVLTEAQLQALAKAKYQREAHGEIETQHPSYLGAQDAYYIGNIKGIGRIYQQTFIDTYHRVALPKSIPRRMH
ncbi:Integrase core domain [Yersinia wautersii]|uniref:Integrase core domain n=1 Tax=Yersinia wautersii TaxID=1341643 RepID=A0ABP1ZKB5_9GAMM|nr:Integrase core domain [Yersinia wautersii]